MRIQQESDLRNRSGIKTVKTELVLTVGILVPYLLSIDHTAAEIVVSISV